MNAERGSGVADGRIENSSNAGPDSNWERLWHWILGAFRGSSSVEPRTRVARLVRMFSAAVAGGWIYSSLAFHGNEAGGERGTAFLVAMGLMTFGPEALLRLALPVRAYPRAERLFILVPWLFGCALVVQALSVLAALALASTQAGVFACVVTR